MFASIIHFEICVIGIPVFSARCFGERFAKSETVFTPAISSSKALLGPIPSISVKFDSLPSRFSISLSRLESLLGLYEEYLGLFGLMFLLAKNAAKAMIVP